MCVWPMSALEPLLSVSDLVAGYGATEILRGVDFAVRANEVVAVLGANGAGKSTLNRAISGVVRPWDGAIRFADAAIERERPAAIVSPQFKEIKGWKIATPRANQPNRVPARGSAAPRAARPAQPPRP